MLTKEVSQKYFNNALVSIHKSRASTLFEASWALTKGANLTLTSLGRYKDGGAYVKHKIKSMDRLLGNKKLHDEIHTIYKDFYQPLFSSLTTLFIIVDWSGCCRKDMHMLRATVMHEGRGITIYNEIHPEKKVGNRSVHCQFLANLAKIIPFGKRVVIITDSGFITPWFKAVLKLGWDYIGRVNTKINVRVADQSQWIKSRQIDKEATSRVKYVGYSQIGMTTKTSLYGHVYSFKQKTKGRKEKSSFPDVNKRYARSARNAWILVTSLSHKSFHGSFIKDRYRKRMQIEQNFRDDKSPRFGFGWRMARTACSKRIAILCLIASLAAFFLWCIGVLAEKLGLHKKYQVNTVSTHRVLSLPFLGKQIILHAPPQLDENYREAMQRLIKNHEKLLLW